MYWVELHRKGKPSFYVQEKGESIIGAGFLATERMRRKGYDPDSFTRIGFVARPPPKESHDRIFYYEELSDEIHRALRKCPNCDKIVPGASVCLSCGAVLDAELERLMKNHK